MGSLNGHIRKPPNLKTGFSFKGKLTPTVLLSPLNQKNGEDKDKQDKYAQASEINPADNQKLHDGP